MLHIKILYTAKKSVNQLMKIIQVKKIYNFVVDYEQWRIGK